MDASPPDHCRGELTLVDFVVIYYVILYNFSYNGYFYCMLSVTNISSFFLFIKFLGAKIFVTGGGIIVIGDIELGYLIGHVYIKGLLYIFKGYYFKGYYLKEYCMI